jgi:ribosomal protein L11 methyltransferase
MIELMQKINFKNKKVLDFGTGTGVLAILAEKLGASSVLAIDWDEWSINNACENIGINNCKHIIIEKRNNIMGISFVDTVLVNINFNVLEENAKNLSTLLKTGSVLIISGFLSNDENNIVSVFVKNDFVKKQLSKT